MSKNPGSESGEGDNEDSQPKSQEKSNINEIHEVSESWTKTFDSDKGL